MDFEFWDDVSQWVISIVGITAIVMVSLKNRWGFVIGLLQQPFWFITAYVNHQNGALIASIGFTASWIFGIYQWFWAEPKKEIKK